MTTGDPNRTLSISFPGLLAIYLAIPVCLAVVLCDATLFHGHLRHALPRNPEDLRFLTIFIVLPHIVASASSFIDKEYVSYYKTRLLYSIPLVAFLVFVLPLFGAQLAFTVYAGYTVFHVMAQQIGITTMMVGKPDNAFKFWKWLSIGLAAVIYLFIFADPRLWSLRVAGFSLRLAVSIGLGIGLVALSLVGRQVAAHSRTEIGKKYLWANNAMIAMAALSFFMGYQFFAIFVPRIIHDLSGFVFYAVHDNNRNAEQSRNLFYRLFNFTRLPIVVLSPLLAILVANGLTQASHIVPWLSKGLLGLAYFHYYTEGFMWKRDAIHRQAVVMPKPVPAAATALSPVPSSMSPIPL
jgi:hypothetical protein